MIEDPIQGLELLERLVSADFDRRCSATRFCSTCRHLVCPSCCPEHAAACHADDAAGRTVFDIHMLEGKFPAVGAVAVRRGLLGYNWTKIQRIKHDDNSYVVLGQEQPNWKNRWRKKGRCVACKDRVEAAVLYCCAACKLNAVHQGGGRDAMRSLVDSDFTRLHFHDRFCTDCGRSYASEFCSVHAHHHEEQAAVHILSIFRHDGWTLIPAEQLPQILVSAVKRVVLDDGSAAVPIHPRKEPSPEGARLCNRCQEGVADEDRFCSLECKGSFG